MIKNYDVPLKSETFIVEKNVRSVSDRVATQRSSMKTVYILLSLSDIRFPQKLDMLNLNGNRVEFLTGGTFTKLKELRVLKLNNNKISRLNPRALKHLIKLEVKKFFFGKKH